MTTARPLLTAAATLAALLLAAPGHGAPATTDADPAGLVRGADATGPHVVRGHLVDGALDVKVGATGRYLGKSGDAYVVAGAARNGSPRKNRLLRIAEDGSTALLARRVSPWDAVLSSDGSRVFVSTNLPGPGEQMRSRFRVIDAVTGKVHTDRVVGGFGRVLAATRTRAYLSDFELGTFTLNAKGRRFTTVSAKPAGALDLEHNLISLYTGDPYAGGCTKLVRLDAPGKKLWKSCTERIEVFNTDGTGFATVGILSDGIGPGVVVTRTLDGTLTGRYGTFWFGALWWESPTALVAESNGKSVAALVRCDTGTCEKASVDWKTPDIRTAARP